MLRAARQILHGPLPETFAAVADANNPWRKLPFALLLASLLLFGFFPRLLTEKITPSAERIVSMATNKTSERAMVDRPLSGSTARPHPGPLPRERENRLLSLGMPGVAEKLNDYQSKENGRALSPLPGGEGQGEGERGVKAQKDQSLLASAATK